MKKAQMAIIVNEKGEAKLPATVPVLVRKAQPVVPFFKGPEVLALPMPKAQMKMLPAK